MTNHKEDLFASYEEKASELWDVERLLTDLGEVRGKELSETEQLYLYLLLVGYSPKEIAEETHRSAGTVRTALSSNLYPGLKDLLDLDMEADPNGNGKSGNNGQKLEWHKVMPALMKKGYHQDKNQGLTEGGENVTLEIASDFQWRIKQALKQRSPKNPPHLLQVKSTDYNRIYIEEISEVAIDGGLHISANWKGQFREDVPRALRGPFKLIFPKEIYQKGNYLKWVDVDGKLRYSFDLSLDGEGKLQLSVSDVWVSNCSVPQAKFLEGISQAFPEIQSRFSQPLKAFNLLANLDIDVNRIFQIVCEDKYRAATKNSSFDSQKIVNFEIDATEMRVTVRSGLVD